MNSSVFTAIAASIAAKESNNQFSPNSLYLNQIAESADVAAMRAIFTSTVLTVSRGNDAKRKSTENTQDSPSATKQDPPAKMQTRVTRKPSERARASADAKSSIKVAKTLFPIDTAYELLSADEAEFLARPENWSELHRRIMINWKKAVPNYQKAVNLIEYLIRYNLAHFIKLINVADQLLADILLHITEYEEMTSGNRVGHILFQYGVGSNLYLLEQGRQFVTQMFSINKNKYNDAGMSMMQLLATNKNEPFVIATIKVLCAEGVLDRALVDVQHLLHRGVADLNFEFIKSIKVVCVKEAPDGFVDALMVSDKRNLMPIHNAFFLTNHAQFEIETPEEFKQRMITRRDDIFEWLKFEMDPTATRSQNYGWQIRSDLANLVHSRVTVRAKGGVLVHEATKILYNMYRSPLIHKYTAFLGYNKAPSQPVAAATLP